MIPVGECSYGYITLLMGESGKMYGTYADNMLLYGNNYVEAIESIYNRTFLKKIPLTHKQQLVEDALKNAWRKFKENEVKVQDVTCESAPNDPKLCIRVELREDVYDKYENEGIIEKIKKIIMKSLEENHYLEEFNEEVDFSFRKLSYN